MPVRLNSSGGGSVTLDVPAVGTTTTLNLPTANGTLLASDGSGNVTVSGTATFSGNATFNAGLIPSSSFLRNRIINGAFDVWQRGTSFTNPANITYLADRWFVGIAGSSPASAVQVAGPAGFQYALQVAGAAGNSTVQINQRIESVNTYDLVGQSVAIQAVIQVSSAQTVGWALFCPNSKDNFGSLTQIASGTWSATTTSTRFTATAANMPAQVANGLMLLLTPNNGGAFTSGTITVTGVQLEVGSVATPFERRQFGQELALCQRYYQTGEVRVEGYNVGGAPIKGQQTFLCTMRSTPTMAFSFIGSASNVSGNILIEPYDGGVAARMTVTSSGNAFFNSSYTASAEL